MEYLIIAVILYFILQAAGNIVLLMRGDDRSGLSGRDREPGHDWRGPSPRQQTGADQDRMDFWGEDIEDATWTDMT